MNQNLKNEENKDLLAIVPCRRAKNDFHWVRHMLTNPLHALKQPFVLVFYKLQTIAYCFHLTLDHKRLLLAIHSAPHLHISTILIDKHYIYLNYPIELLLRYEMIHLHPSLITHL